ncbi:helix-turn-helix transcriptional regulator [Euzebyella saccharophila]|uniref:Helix-turn-helix transcriptional regulator n=1 Tax=Euzebyella saccharophila TaxID=679664 RepID=A0ABV8JR83_9FLAO|nr:helix-turn-helix transcriptional regulator [Euzebyella saccharophila]
MVNTSEFIERLEILLTYYDLSASAFADKVDVQRSSISHLLSGRNKPSLEFVLKVIKAFPEVNLYWLLNGKGSFPQNEKLMDKTSPPSFEQEKIQPKEVPSDLSTKQKKIERIVLFYSDGSFESFDPS